MPQPTITQNTHNSLWVALGIYTLLLLTVWAFMPGLGGTLIFDDIPNFLPWQELGDINTFNKAAAFVTSGTGFPGRPLSLLSFLLDDQSWTPDIRALKRTNLAIHLVNSCLIFWLFLLLLRHLLPHRSPQQQAWLALFATAIWSMHPLQVSNVSYVIQRMNLLSTTLELAGLVIFIHGREQLEQSPAKAIVLCSLAIGLFMPLAILAKENGLLLCVFALLTEAFCFERSKLRLWQAWKLVFLWFPLFSFVIYCLFLSNFATDYAARSFNAWERMLTQGPVLADYIEKLLLPRLHGSGLYFDNFPISRSLLAPLNTLYCWMGVIAMLVLAFLVRKTLPLFSFGIFFYFCGHLMESTLLPLELYFEHRNYLPQIGLWLSLIALASVIRRPLLQKMLTISMPLIVIMLLLMTRHNASLWGNPELQTTIWYQENPGSLRNTLAYANLQLQKGDYYKANMALGHGMSTNPGSLILVISQRYVQCYWQNLPVSFSDLPLLARHADHEYASIIMLEKMRSMSTTTPSREGECSPATPHEIGKIYLGILENPRYASPRTRSRLFEYMAEISVSERQLDNAMHYYDQAFATSQNPIYPYRQATLLQSAGLGEQAAQFAKRSRSALGPRQKIQYPDLERRLLLLEKELSAEKQGPGHP